MPTSTGRTRVRSPDPPEPRTGIERLGDTNSSLAKRREDRARRRTSDLALPPPPHANVALLIPQNLETDSSDSETQTRRWLSLARIAARRRTSDRLYHLLPL
ncbi:hypothetical protein DFP72DRAFT_1048044 [Ephemerocybe angulata]|uniref:Uncharacterized protein n=1 Tax=Ephemerocybe angulata TaxID=980116 RepID=A0A8H6HRB1_9AGAR|nr:hypothetical protein DFP72DRAFT_1048044 [Tulosesus angulatus]